MVSKSGAVAFSSIVLRWAPAWAPSGLLCFAGHGVLAAKNTIVGFEIRKFPGFFFAALVVKTGPIQGPVLST